MSTDSAQTRFLQHTPHGFSNVVEVTGGRLVFITGQMALDATGTLVGEGDYKAQLEQVFENIKTQLDVVGADFSQVIKITTLAEVGFAEHALEFGEVRDRYINLENPPASAIFLAPKLIHPGALVDISAIAHLPLA
ncbi:RidA family protein [Frigoribacterium faeni]|jgi:enamine deaminase RidA (YjgF/YER057c/UK114 family)|uniref:Enamine deaminase RidA n=1 Tax=Frigoribacterium faeni TaxID=145483 RepID=A0A7W3JKC6_9MICO|nr:RidA family protein [Frigoribacterium faeni]MBA8814381.1 enamine deaminase RidA (YjgF/YER057c/UK114 family) [Frigoribacterium faeni]BFF15835.1 RidA family protein [Microbacterium flavescens]GEK84034.1 enamine deaminase RidA [Frigoribacterium faeni]